MVLGMPLNKFLKIIYFSLGFLLVFQTYNPGTIFPRKNMFCKMLRIVFSSYFYCLILKLYIFFTIHVLRVIYFMATINNIYHVTIVNLNVLSPDIK